MQDSHLTSLAAAGVHFRRRLPDGSICIQNIYLIVKSIITYSYIVSQFLFLITTEKGRESQLSQPFCIIAILISAVISTLSLAASNLPDRYLSGGLYKAYGFRP